MRMNQKGFTLMELMVVIVIVAILAAVAVPLYINYVKDAQRTEAKGAIGAVITAEQTHFQRYNNYLNYADADFTNPPVDDINRHNCDIHDAQNNWTFDVTLPNGTTDGFVVTAKGKAAQTNGLTVTYTASKQSPPTTPWTEQ